MTVAKLSDQEIVAALAKLSGWSRVDGRSAIAKKFQFADFNAAWGFMAASRSPRRSRTTTPSGSTSGIASRSRSRRTTPAGSRRAT